MQNNRNIKSTLFQDRQQINDDLIWISERENLLHLSNDEVIDFKTYFQTPIQIQQTYRNSNRIGLYYQWLLRHQIQTSSSLNLIADEIQIVESGRTIGEIDFLVQHLDHNDIAHWEVAIKFYLLFEDQWIGPNAQDHLNHKIQKMRSQQLALSQKPCFKNHFNHLTIKSRRIALQGRLYINPYLKQPKFISPEINANRIKGYWCWQNQIDQKQYFQHLNRDQWLKIPRFNPARSMQITQDIQKAIHVIDAENTPWFIVPNSWPHHSSSAINPALLKT